MDFSFVNGGPDLFGPEGLRVVLLFKDSGFMVVNGTLTYLQLQQPGCRRGRPAGVCCVCECSAQQGCEGDTAV